MQYPQISWVKLGFNDMSTLVGHFALSPKGRKEIEEIVKEMKEGGAGKKEELECKWRNRRNKNITSLSLPATTIAGLVQL